MNIFGKNSEELSALPRVADHEGLRRIREQLERLKAQRERTFASSEAAKESLRLAQQAAAGELASGKTNELPRLAAERKAIADLENDLTVLELAIEQSEEREKVILQEARSTVAIALREISFQITRKEWAKLEEAVKLDQLSKFVHKHACDELGHSQTEVLSLSFQPIAEQNGGGSRLMSWIEYCEKAGVSFD